MPIERVARGWVRETLRQALGRRPTPAEVSFGALYHRFVQHALTQRHHVSPQERSLNRRMAEAMIPARGISALDAGHAPDHYLDM